VHSSLWLSALLVVPLLGSLGAALGRGKQGLAYAVAVASAVVENGDRRRDLLPLQRARRRAQTFDFATRYVVSAPFGLAYDVALDGISLFMVELTAIVVLLALLGGRDKRREPSFVSWLLILTSFTMGSFVAHDLLEFFIFFELTLVPCYFIISGWGGAEKNKAALKFFIYTFSASAFLLIGILYLGLAHQHQTQGRSPSPTACLPRRR